MATLFGLPIELRNEIYSYLLLDDRPILARVFRPNREGPQDLRRLNLLLVNKQIHQESSNLFYGYNTFVFSNLCELTVPYNIAFLREIGHHARQIQRIGIPYQPTSESLSQIYDGAERPYVDACETHFREHLKIHYPNITTVRIHESVIAEVMSLLFAYPKIRADSAAKLVVEHFRPVWSIKRVILEYGSSSNMQLSGTKFPEALRNYVGELNEMGFDVPEFVMIEIKRIY